MSTQKQDRRKLLDARRELRKVQADLDSVKTDWAKFASGIRELRDDKEALEVELKLTREARDKYAQSQADCSVKLDKAEREVRVMQDDCEELKKKNHGHLQARSEIIAMLEVLIEREIMIKFDPADGYRVESITDLGRQLRVVKEKCFVDGVRRRYNTTGIVHTDLNFEG